MTTINNISIENYDIIDCLIDRYGCTYDYYDFCALDAIAAYLKGGKWSFADGCFKRVGGNDRITVDGIVYVIDDSDIVVDVRFPVVEYYNEQEAIREEQLGYLYEIETALAKAASREEWISILNDSCYSDIHKDVYGYRPHFMRCPFEN